MSCEPKESLVEDLMWTLMVGLARSSRPRPRPRDVRPGKYQQQPGVLDHVAGQGS